MLNPQVSNLHQLQRFKIDSIVWKYETKWDKCFNRFCFKIDSIVWKLYPIDNVGDYGMRF